MKDILKKYGADILRAWVAASDYSEDLRLDYSILEQHAESYRKIRNTFRFLLGNLRDQKINFDTNSKVACETLVTTGQVVLAGEVRSETYIDVQEVARRVINKIGYTKGEYRFEGDSCGVLSAIHEQSSDINRGVDRDEKMNQGAGDQGMMFGYACKETDEYMPLALELSQRTGSIAVCSRSGETIVYVTDSGRRDDDEVMPAIALAVEERLGRQG